MRNIQPVQLKEKKMHQATSNFSKTVAKETSGGLLEWHFFTDVPCPGDNVWASKVGKLHIFHHSLDTSISYHICKNSASQSSVVIVSGMQL